MSDTNEKTPLIAVKRPEALNGVPRVFLMTASGGRLPEIRALEWGQEPPTGVSYWEPGDEPLPRRRPVIGVQFIEYQGIVHQSIEEAVAQARKAIKAHPNAQFDPEIGGVDVQGATPELLEAMALVMRHGGVE